MLTAGLTPPSAPGQDLQSLRPWRRTTKRRQRKEAATQIANVLLQQLGLNGSGRTLSDPQNKRLSSSKPSAGRQAVVVEAASSPSHLTIFASLPPFITISLFSAERGLKLPGSVTYFPVEKKPTHQIIPNPLYLHPPSYTSIPPSPPYVDHPAERSQAPVFTRSPQSGIINRRSLCARMERRATGRRKAVNASLFFLPA